MCVQLSDLSLGPVLLGFDSVSEGCEGKSEVESPARDEPKHREEPWHELPRHRDEDQVRLDVDRSFVYYPNGKCYVLCYYSHHLPVYGVVLALPFTDDN